MTKFARVLSDEYIDNIVLGSPITIGKSLNRSKDFILMIEQAVLARLAEQEPVAWTSSKIFGHYATHDTKVSSAEWFKENLDVPLYAHPCVTLVSNKPIRDSQNDKYGTQTPDGTLIGEGTKRHIEYIKRYQRWRRGEDKTMDEMELTPKQIGESLDWLIGVAENHISKGINI